MSESSVVQHGSPVDRGPVTRAIVLLLIGIVLSGCDVNRYQSFQGHTMGTYYRVVANCSTKVTQDLLDYELQWLSSILSTYEPESEISSFNRSRNVGEWVPTHEILVDLISIAQDVSARTNGAFDITVAPLVELWGFGTVERTQPPRPESITRTLQVVDYKLLELDEHKHALRKLSDIKLDLSGIGKGYGVDHLAKILVGRDCPDFLVDIGGEIRVHGRNAAKKPWRVGIEVPDGIGQVQAVLGLSAGALATSGSYRNFRVYDETIYPHLIDPRTGYPTSHSLLAVSVYHATATKADALATAFFVMGFDKAMEVAEVQEIAVALTTWDAETENVRISYSTTMEDLMKVRN